MRYSPVDGTLLPLGVTRVIAEVEEAGLPPSACTFLITVKDTTAPTLQCPADIETQVAEGGRSLPYTFAATATDAVTAEPPLTLVQGQGDGVGVRLWLRRDAGHRWLDVARGAGVVAVAGAAPARTERAGQYLLRVRDRFSARSYG
ncbi:hypothetical protein COEX109129_06945 [Corallococcus exiguus]